MNLIHEKATPYHSQGTQQHFESFIDWYKNGKITNQVLENYIIELVVHPNYDTSNKIVRYFKKYGDIFMEIANHDDYEQKSMTWSNFSTEKGIGHEKGLYYELHLYLEKIIEPVQIIPQHSYLYDKNKPNGKSSQTYYCVKPWEAKHIAGVGHKKCNEFSSREGISSINSVMGYKYGGPNGIEHGKFVINGKPSAVDKVMIEMSEWLKTCQTVRYSKFY